MRYQAKASRAGRGVAREGVPETYNALKARWTRDIALIARRGTGTAPPAPTVPAVIEFVWYEPDRKRDPDGVAAGGAKLILDGLVAAGILAGDGSRNVRRLAHDFVYDAQLLIGVEVRLLYPLGHWQVTIPHRLPDLNELLAARELGARRSMRRFGR